MLVIAASISASVGLGLSASSAAAAMIMPLWQKPHCGTSSAIHAFCSGCDPCGDRPSMVTIFSLALTVETGRRHVRIGTPSMSTVHAPHCATPQPYLVPVNPSCSRNTHNSGVSGSTSTLCTLPLTFKVVISTISRLMNGAPQAAIESSDESLMAPPGVAFANPLRYSSRASCDPALARRRRPRPRLDSGQAGFVPEAGTSHQFMSGVLEVLRAGHGDRGREPGICQLVEIDALGIPPRLR